MGKHFGKTIIEQVLQMKEQGMTHRAIGEKFGLTKIQIKKLVERYNKKNRSPAVVPNRRGRQRERPLTPEQDYIIILALSLYADRQYLPDIYIKSSIIYVRGCEA